MSTPTADYGVSGILRLTLLTHGMTNAMSAGRFPTDEPLNALGIRQVRALGDLGSTEVVKRQLRATGSWGPPKPSLRKLNADDSFALAA